MKNKVIVRIFGGLGNQLFCYAAARRLSLINNAELVIDDITGFKYDYIYKRYYQLQHFQIMSRKASPLEVMEPFSKSRRYIKRQWNKRKNFEVRNYIQQEGRSFDNRLLQVQIKKTVYLEGYWQSENYFKDIESILRNDLEIIPPTDRFNMFLASKIKSQVSVAVHVRFFDKDSNNIGLNTPQDYYARAIEEMEKRLFGAHYYLFSDDPIRALELIKLPQEKITIVSHNSGDQNAYADLWLMSLCKYFIIANSTFSWWGAWLSSFPGKEIIAPHLINNSAWNFDGLIPEKWQKM